MLFKSEWNALDKIKKKLKFIARRDYQTYQYQEGLYQYYIKKQSRNQKAVSVLSTSAEYNSILKL